MLQIEYHLPIAIQLPIFGEIMFKGQRNYISRKVYKYRITSCKSNTWLASIKNVLNTLN